MEDTLADFFFYGTTAGGEIRVKKKLSAGPCYAIKSFGKPSKSLSFPLPSVLLPLN